MRWPWQRDRGVPPVADPAPRADAAARHDAAPRAVVQRAAGPAGADPAGAAAPGAPAESTAGWAFLPPLQRVVQPVALTSRPVAFLADLPTRAPVRFTGAMSHVVDARAPSGLVDPDPGGPPVQRSVDLDLPLLPPAPRADAPVQRRATGGLVGLDAPPAGVPRLRAVPVEPPVPPVRPTPPSDAPLPAATVPTTDGLPDASGWTADGWAAPDLASDAGGSGATTVAVASLPVPPTAGAPVVQRRVGLGAPLPTGQRTADVRQSPPDAAARTGAAVTPEPPRLAAGAPLDVVRGADPDAPVQRVVGPASSAAPPAGSPARPTSVQRAVAPSSGAPAAAGQHEAVAPAALGLPSMPDLVLPPTGPSQAPEGPQLPDAGATPVAQRAVPIDAPAAPRTAPADAPVVQRSATATPSSAAAPTAAPTDRTGDSTPSAAGDGLRTTPTLADATPLTAPPAPGTDGPVAAAASGVDLPLAAPAVSQPSGPSDGAADRAEPGPSAREPLAAPVPAPEVAVAPALNGGPVVSRLTDGAPAPAAPTAPVPLVLRDGPLLGGPRVPLTVASTASPAVLRAPAGAARPAVALQRAVPDAPAVATSRSLPSTVSARPLTGAAAPAGTSSPGGAPAVSVSRLVAAPAGLPTGAPVTPVPVAGAVEADAVPSLDLAPGALHEAPGSADAVASPDLPAPDAATADAPGTDDGTPSVALDSPEAPPAASLDVVPRTAPVETGTPAGASAPAVPLAHPAAPAPATPLVVSRTTSPAPATTRDDAAGPASAVAGRPRGAAAPDLGAGAPPLVLAQRTTTAPSTPTDPAAVPVAPPLPAAPLALAAPAAPARPVGLAAPVASAPPVGLAPPAPPAPVQLTPARGPRRAGRPA
ncbi:hypothetical protein HLB10_19205, partial [Cellulomonas fimi]|nr:hypothetical protein [Cellulomonas fimi]